MITRILVLFLAAPALQAAAQESAPEKELPWRSTELRLGVFFASSDASIEVKSSGGVGASVDFNDVLGMSESTQAFRAEASFALGTRHRLHLDMFSLSRKGDRTLSSDLQ